MSVRFMKSALVAAVSFIGGVSASARGATFTPFSFTSNTSTSGLYANSGLGGDLRLDSIKVNGTTLLPAQIQTVNGAAILVDDGIDAVNGGHNLAAARGIGGAADPWAPDGPATVTPTSADLQAAQANYNLASITVTRENVGTALVDYTFAQPTTTFFYWERGIDSDATIEALDAGHNVIASYHILRQEETNTNLLVSSENGAFNLQNLKLGSLGLQLSQPVSELRVLSVQLAPGGTGAGDDGPDYKLLAAAPGTVAAVPLPSAAWMGFGTLAAITPLVARLRRRRRVMSAF